MKSDITIREMIEKLDNKILEKRSMAIIGIFFLVLTIISVYLFLTVNEGVCFFPVLVFGILALLAFTQLKDPVNPNYPEWPDPPQPEP